MSKKYILKDISLKNSFNNFSLGKSNIKNNLIDLGIDENNANEFFGGCPDEKIEKIFNRDKFDENEIYDYYKSINNINRNKEFENTNDLGVGKFNFRDKQVAEQF